MLVHYDELNPRQIYKIMSQSIIPRPIAWIITEDEGVINAAPFSYFTPLSSSPATVIVSIGRKDDKTPKDTLANIRSTKKATICFVHEDSLDDMINTANVHDKSQSEVEIYNISTESILQYFPPIIKNAKSAMFCTLHSEVELEGQTKPVILKIESQYFHDEIISENFNIDLDNVARVGKNFAKMIDI